MDRETVFANLWARLSSSVTGTKTYSRRVMHWEAVPPVDQPAMFMEQVSSQFTNEPGRPGKNVLTAKVLLYAFEETSDGPMPIVNGLVKQVEDCLVRQPNELSGGPYTTLSGSVIYAKPVGVEFGGGNVGDQGVGIVTIEMMAPT